MPQYDVINETQPPPGAVSCFGINKRHLREWLGSRPSEIEDRAGRRRREQGVANAQGDIHTFIYASAQPQAQHCRNLTNISPISSTTHMEVSRRAKGERTLEICCTLCKDRLDDFERRAREKRSVVIHVSEDGRNRLEAKADYIPSQRATVGNCVRPFCLICISSEIQNPPFLRLSSSRTTPGVDDPTSRGDRLYQLRMAVLNVEVMQP